MSRQATLTFAMARHAVVDLSQVLGVVPRAPEQDRLPLEALARLRRTLLATGAPFQGDPSGSALAELRAMYEPYLSALSEYLLMPLPAWILEDPRSDNWETSAWEVASTGRGAAGGGRAAGDREDGETTAG